MNKELTPLEALEKIKNTCILEDMPKVILPEECEIIEKSLKALEIIKNKCVDIGFVKSTKNYEEYINDYEVKYLYKEEYILTQEEFDLVKEVLL